MRAVARFVLPAQFVVFVLRVAWVWRELCTAWGRADADAYLSLAVCAQVVFPIVTFFAAHGICLICSKKNTSAMSAIRAVAP